MPHGTVSTSSPFHGTMLLFPLFRFPSLLNDGASGDEVQEVAEEEEEEEEEEE
ncbi:hypothetical protein L249_1214, partial [Ophiocordyceps polyrhachis-furcata BCC 54312]